MDPTRGNPTRGAASSTPSIEVSENISEFNNWCDEPARNEEKWQKGRKQPTSQERFGTTWDMVVVPGMVAEAMNMSDTSYGSFVNFGNIFGTCFHYIVPTSCLCPKLVIGMVCTKCHITFCDQNCLRMQVENRGILSPEAQAAIKSQRNNAPKIPGHPCVGNNSTGERKLNHYEQKGLHIKKPDVKTASNFPHGRAPYRSDLPRNSYSGPVNDSQKSTQPSSSAQFSNANNSRQFPAQSSNRNRQFPPHSLNGNSKQFPAQSSNGNSKQIPGASSAGNSGGRQFPPQHRDQHNLANVGNQEEETSKGPTKTANPPKMERILRNFDDFKSKGVNASYPTNGNKDALSSTSSTISSPVSAGSDTPKPYNTIIGIGRGKSKAMLSWGSPNRAADDSTSSTTSAISSPYSETIDFETTKLGHPRAIDLEYEPPVSLFEMGCLFVDSPSFLGMSALKGAHIQKDLNKKFGDGSRDGLQQLTNFSVGGYALSPHADSCSLYRSKILKVYKDFVKVYYLDFGNTSKLPKVGIMKLPDHLFDEPTCTIIFGLSNVVPFGENGWSQEAMTFIATFYEEMVRCKVQYTEICNETGMHKYIGKVMGQYRTKDWRDLGEIMIEEGWAQKRDAKQIQSKIDDQSWQIYNKEPICAAALYPELSIERKVHATISYVNHPQDFYITLKEEKREREQMFGELNRLLGRKNVADAYNPVKGNICAALINDQWQRVKVTLIKKDLKKALILLIDNGETVRKPLDGLMEIPHNYKSQPAFAYHCKLPIVAKESSGWSPQLIKNLKDLQKLSADCFQAKCFHIENGINTVELFPTSESFGWSQALITIGDARAESDKNLSEDSADPIHAVNSTSPRGESPKKIKTVTTNSPTKESTVLPQNSSPRKEEPISPVKKTVAQNEKCVSAEDSIPTESVSSKGTSKIHLPSPTSLVELQEDVFTVHMMSFPNVVFIVPQANLRQNIKEAITNHIEYLRLNPIKNFNPKLQDVVCVEYHGEIVRGIVDKIDETTNMAWVSMFDYGVDVFRKVSVSELQPVNHQIMTFPPLGYTVKLPVTVKWENIVKKDRSGFQAKLKKSLFVLSTKVTNGPLPQNDTGETIYEADLQVVGNDQTLLSKMVTNLTKMDWELFYDAGYKTPSSIISRGDWKGKTLADFYEIEEDFHLNVKKSAKILKMFIFDGVLNVILLKENTKDIKLMTTKLKSYYNKIHHGAESETEVTPAGDVQLVGVRLNNQKSQISKMFDTQWQRAMKRSNRICSLDDYTDWTTTGQTEIAETRELCPEFLEIPSACYHTILPDIELTKDATKLVDKYFTPGKEIKFELTEIDKQAGEKTIYTMKCPELEKLLIRQD